MMDFREEKLREDLGLLSNKFISSRATESMCPFPGRLKQRDESLVLLEVVCQVIRSACSRLLLGSRDIPDSDIMLAFDRFLCECNEEAEYSVKGLSEAKAEMVGSVVRKIFGPVEYMDPEPKEVTRKEFLRVMKAFDDLLFHLHSTEPESDHLFFALAKAFLRVYSLCRRHYMLTVS